jgi:hypothetical protein
MSAKPTRRIQYAARIPNAIEPADAQINIAKFNKSAIALPYLPIFPGSDRCCSRQRGKFHAAAPIQLPWMQPD